MTSEITIKKNTSLEGIEKYWLHNLLENLVFNITQQSSFQLFVEGISLGYLEEIIKRGTTISINLKYVKAVNEEEDFTGFPPILHSIFGLELLHVCKCVYLDDGGKNKNWKSEIGNYVWKNVLNNAGSISSGKKVYLISRHGYEVPRRLREDPAVINFPTLSFFKTAIYPLILSMRGSKELGFAETALIEWIHQIAENAYQHGSMDNSKKTIDGYRGIYLQKYILNNEVQRDEFPVKVQEYITKVIKEKPWESKKVIVNSATVCDLGIGIQNTLTSSAPSFDLLNSAFKDGVTQKNVGSKEAGYGLGQALNAAKNLQALLYVVSSNLVASLDLSIDTNNRTSPLKFEMELSKEHGTSISLVWLTVL